MSVHSAQCPDFVSIEEAQASLPAEESISSGASSWYLCVKSAIEVVLALILLALSAPVMLLVAVAVKLTSRGPVLYWQIRVGRYGQPYAIYKIRTMIHECESLSGPRWATADDDRITPIGRFLRRTH